MFFFGFGFSLIVQVLLVVHVFKTGRDRFWIYVLVFLPLAGPVAYLLIEVLPDLLRSRAADATGRAIVRAVNPKGQLRALEAQLAACPTVANKSALAAALLDAGEADRAVELLEAARSGIYRDDPKLLSLLGRAYAQAGRQPDAAAAVAELRRLHPDLASADDLLRQAVALGQAGDGQAAEAAFRAALAKSGAFEIKWRFAEFLEAAGRSGEARAVHAEIAAVGATLPGHSRRREARWIALAKDALAKRP